MSFSSCMVVGSVAGGKKTTFEKEFELNSKNTINKNKADIKEVLYNDGWNKFSEDKNTITFTKESTILGQLVFAKTKVFTLVSTFDEESIKLEIVQHGNFKLGTEENINETFLKIEEDYEKL